MIPKSDTELLVELALDEIKTRARNPKESAHGGKAQLYIADVCTGSGCVILSIIKTLEQNRSGAFKDIRLVCRASDISEKALRVARKNAARLLDGSAIEKPRFFCADLLGFGPPAGSVSENRYDIIVSNPPYVPSKTAAELLEDGRSEPLLALDGGKDGLDIIRRLVPQAFTALKKGGVFLVETGEYNAGETRSLMTKSGFIDIVTYNDLGGLPRVTRGVKAK